MKNNRAKGNKTIHTPNTQFGHGEYGGMAIRNKQGRVKESMIDAVSKVSKLKPKTKKNMA